MSIVTVRRLGFVDTHPTIHRRNWYPEALPGGPATQNILRATFKGEGAFEQAPSAPYQEGLMWVGLSGLGIGHSEEQVISQAAVAAYIGVSVVGAGLAAYHGFQRTGTAGGAVGWGVLGLMFPLITNVVALAQGFGERKR